MDPPDVEAPVKYEEETTEPSNIDHIENGEVKVEKENIIKYYGNGNVKRSSKSSNSICPSQIFCPDHNDNDDNGHRANMRFRQNKNLHSEIIMPHRNSDSDCQRISQV